jgi:thiol-disulfide isomerase/thioredoxin
MKDLLIILGILAILFWLCDKPETFTQKNSNVLYFFYADWCPHCSSMKPVWTDIETHFAESGISTKAVNCELPENRKLVNDHQVTGYPTIIFSQDRYRKVKYRGERTAPSIIKWVTELSQEHAPRHREMHVVIPNCRKSI